MTRPPNGLNNWASSKGRRTAWDPSPIVLSSCLPQFSSAESPRLPVAATAQQEAITATVMGENIQKVGYRAMIQKQAIMYNLAGYARNNPDGTVGVRLQGDKDRIEKTLEAISAGTKTSSKANIIGEIQTALDPNLRRSPSSGGHRRAGRSRTPMTWSLTCDPPMTRSRQRGQGGLEHDRRKRARRQIEG